ncbi:uncharacterized protein LOC129571680, partial [Sitodiplosis mosellana]|uniref:uncharacterized protein LOC129571680 n=1 Tax=Sitodiplosis mosellana TaxID=263140 RepID=UPI0024452DBC
MNVNSDCLDDSVVEENLSQEFLNGNGAEMPNGKRRRSDTANRGSLDLISGPRLSTNDNHTNGEADDSVDKTSGILSSKHNIEKKLAILKEKKSQGKLNFSRKTGPSWSKWWGNFEEIFDGDSKEEFVRCKLCKGYEYKPGTNTNSIMRHKCHPSQRKPVHITTEMISKLKTASACFVSKDLRPFKAIECEGFLDICTACMHFGQKYKSATRRDLEDAMPSRNTVRNAVAEIAKSNRNKIKDVLWAAIETGGVAATTDCWQDDFRKRHYICVVVHLTTDNPKKEITRSRYVLATREIPELCKTGKVLIDHIIAVFGEYGFSEEEVKMHFTFVSDHGADIKSGLLNNGFKRLTCYAHIIHNLVSKMLSEETVKGVVDNCSKLSTYVKNAGLNQHLPKSLKKHIST